MARTRQPQGAARIDWSNPLVRLLALAYVGGQRIDVVKQRTATFDADVSVEPVSYGLATRTPVSNGVSFGTGPVITGSSGAVVCLANPTSSGTNYSAAFSQRSTSPNRQFGLLFNSSGVYVSAGSLEAYMFDGTAIPFRTSISNTVIDGKWHSYGANFNGGYFSLFVDGAILDSSSPNEQSVGSCVDASQIVNIGTMAGSSVNGADYKTAFLGVWNRLLSTDEYRSLSENPWQLFASPRRLWIQLGAASGGATIFESTFTDSWSLSDTYSASANLASTYADSPTVIDSSSSSAIFSSAFDETIPVSDGPSADMGGVANRTQEESFTITDAYSASMVANATISETLSAEASASAAAIFNATFAETLPIVDGEEADAGRISDIAENVTVTDAYTAGIVAQATQAESVTTVDTYDTIAIYNPTLEETLPITDAVGATLTVPTSGTVDLSQESIDALAYEIMVQLTSTPVRKL